MDQDNSKGQDKRNWRERLGIGAQGGKDLPKISDDFRKEPTPTSVRPVATARPAPRPAAPSVKPAPMAPRANPKPIAPPPVSPDKLAERLRSQREASTKLAEQRVQVAKQRAEAQFAPPAATQMAVTAPPAAKPKFTFAEENAQPRPAAAAAVRAVTPPQPPPQMPPPQLAPARPPLGGMQPAPSTFAPRPQQAATPQQPMQQGYQPPPMGVPPYQPNYNQQPVPPYRPIDPNTGYAPQQSYVPQQRGFAPPPVQQPNYAQQPNNAARLNVPQRPTGALNPNFAPQQNYAPPVAQPGFNTGPRLNAGQPRIPMPAPATPADNEYEEEYFEEVPTPRASRPSSTDYQQAYREAEYGYEEESPRSKAPWILAALVAATVALAVLGGWIYTTSIKPLMSGQSTTQQVPAVAAPDTPAKVEAEQPVAEKQQPAAATPTKKQIYDRIVGDKEILGGEVAPPAEAPAAIPEPSNTIVDPATGGGEDATPLPIPPPPGGAGEQQGSLDPASEKQFADTITPAAGESQAAVATKEDVSAPLIVADPPAPGDLRDTTATSSNLVPDAETIADTPAAPIIKKKSEAVAKKKIELAKPKKLAEKVSSSKPVVLVAPQKRPQVRRVKPLTEQQTEVAGSTATDGSLYTGDGIVDNATPESNLIEPLPKKKKSLFGDIFKSKDTPAETVADNFDTPEPPPVAAKKAVVSETQVASSAGGFVVQLASFRSRAEAQTEYGRLKAKHSGTLGRFSPIISEATVGGATRYRLSVGSMASKAQANAVCSSLFAGGERDCLVKNR